MKVEKLGEQEVFKPIRIVVTIEDYEELNAYRNAVNSLQIRDISDKHASEDRILWVDTLERIYHAAVED